MDLLAPVVDFMVHNFCRLYFKLSFLSTYTPLHFSVETCFLLYTQSRIEDIKKTVPATRFSVKGNGLKKLEYC